MKTQYALKEIQNNILSQDLIKARSVMDHFPRIDPKEQKAILDELYKTNNHFPLQVLSYLSANQPEYVEEFPKLSGYIQTKVKQYPDIIIQGIKGKNPEKLYFIKLSGKLGLQFASPVLIEEMGRTQEKLDLYEILTSLASLNTVKAIHGISEFLFVDDVKLVTLAIHALGKIGTPEAFQYLNLRLGRDVEKDRLILDIFALQKNELGLNSINRVLCSRFAQSRGHARSLLVSFGSRSLPLLIENLKSKNIEHQIISLNILLEIGDEAAAKAVRKLINQNPPQANVRFAAYETLGELSTRKGDYVLANGLSDPDSNVRIAATRAIDAHLNPALIKGVINLLEHSEREAQKITKALIDTRAENLFKGLINSPVFLNQFTTQLLGNIDQEIRDFFISCLKKEGKTELAHTIEAKTRGNKRIKGKVCAVDDSKAILNIYRSIITELGYEAVLFLEPSKAIAWLMKEKPIFLCTDLNMPDITGIELIREVRKKYTKKELPVFLITTQDETKDNQAALDAGVSEIIQKPFGIDKISKIFEKFDFSKP